jgi:catechol 2,3-dioxygenase-like lactoylglutathione lyase family enzyme
MTGSYAVTALDHVQLAMPAGGETSAEAFYCGVLGFTREPKPENLVKRGGCWFRRGAVVVHLSVAFRADDELPGVRRGYVEDPFGNRIELIAG